MSTEQSVRRRRQRVEAEQEILAAARRLIVERGSHQVTVAELMRHTTLSRKSFYVYFRDRHALLTRLMDPIRADSDAMVTRLRETRRQDPAAAGLACLRDHGQLYVEHGIVLRALAAASAQDSEARAAWRSMVDPVVEALAELIAEEIAEGRSQGLSPTETARALVGMNISYFLEQIVDRGREDVEALADVLLVVWLRTLYG